MSNIAVIGPGAIGGTTAAWLAQDARHVVAVAARTAFTALEVETPYGLISARPQVLIAPAAVTPRAAPFDWVLVATKAYDVSGAAQWLSALCGPRTLVAVLQNGVEHVERFAPFVPAERIVPVMVDCPAERISAGRIRQRGPALMVVPQDRNGAAYADLFADTRIEVLQSADFRSELWKKLCFNNPGALSAVLLKPSVIARHDGVADIMRGMVRECLAVGRAEGAVLDDSLIDIVIARTRDAPPDSINSLHADRIANRPMEIDARNGVIVRLGRRHGIATPLNAMMVALLEAARN